MKILIAPQAFKGSLSALEAARAIQQGVLKAFPNADTCLSPIADGGDGSLDVLMQLPKSTRKTTHAKNALGKAILVPWGILDSTTAVIEFASICGLAHVPSPLRNPLLTTTYGVGEVIRIALDEGYRKFLICVGGTATQDAGSGIAQALGFHLLNKSGSEISVGGAALAHLTHIDRSEIDSRIAEAQFRVACDVNNPLVGLEGTSAIYAAQKGASPEMIEILEKAISHFALIIKKDLGIDIAHMPRAGAGGGAAGGLHAFLNGKLESGVDIILEALHFEEKLKGADLVITGEGCLDSQTVKYGKAPIGIAGRAKQHGIPAIAIVGSIGEGYEKAYRQGITAIYPISKDKKIPEESVNLIVEATQKALHLHFKK